jgi:ribosome-binding protein aMBF1 (putative translation factor)
VAIFTRSPESSTVDFLAIGWQPMFLEGRGVRGKESPEAEAILRDFGERLRAARESRGISQMTLGLSAGVHPTYVSNVERGQRNISLLNIVQLARVLELDVGTLFPSS